MKPKRRFILALGGMTLVVSILLLLQLVNVDRKGKNRTPQGRTFPNISLTDNAGRFISSSDILDKYTYVQICTLSRKSDLVLLKKIIAYYGDRMNILVITDAPTDIEEWKTQEQVWFISDEHSKLKSAFQAPDYSVFYLYKPKGLLISSGDVQIGFEGGIKRIIDLNLLNKYFEYNMIIPEPGSYLKEYPWLNQLEQLKLNQPFAYCLFGLFSSICEGCSSGIIINLMKRIHKLSLEEMGVWCILSPEYTPNDLSCLVTQLSLDFPVEVADLFLGSKWNELGLRYSMSDVNGIIFIVNKEGKVMDVFGRDYIRSKETFIDRCIELSIGAKNE